jgi:hypothetical protein
MTESNDVHVIPLEDLRDHTTSTDCWCCPTEEGDCSGVWIHHSLDNREKYETGEILPQ